MSYKKTIVNSWNEWDPLKHVIVGRADGTCIPAPEPALDAKVPEDSDMRGQYGPRIKDTVDKANQLLDDFSNILKKRSLSPPHGYWKLFQKCFKHVSKLLQTYLIHFFYGIAPFLLTLNMD